MTALAMVIDANGMLQNIQILHTHGEAFDQASIAAVHASTFQPGILAGEPVPVWIDVGKSLRRRTPDRLPSADCRTGPARSRRIEFEDKHHKPLSYTPPIPIHTVDADFTDLLRSIRL